MDNQTIFTREELVAGWHESPLKLLMWGLAKNEHVALPREEAASLIRAVYPLPLEYDYEKRNCNEFAELLRHKVWEASGWHGLGLVCSYSGWHWFNVALLEEGGKPVYELVEPQTGQFVLPGAPTSIGSPESYCLKEGFVLL